MNKLKATPKARPVGIRSLKPAEWPDARHEHAEGDSELEYAVAGHENHSGFIRAMSR